jgi:hypothetical protein
MEINPFNWSLSFLGGTLTIVIAVVFTAASMLLYPGPATLSDHFIGDLGNADLNPVGYILFNFGLILGGMSLIVFMYGMNKWRTKELNDQLFSFAQVSGIVSGIGFVINGNFSESFSFLNIFWYAVSLVMAFVSILLFCIVLQKHPKFNMNVAYFGYIVDLVILVLVVLTLVNVFTTTLSSFTNLLTWLSWSLVMVWIALVVFNTIQLHDDSDRKPSDTNINA